MHASKLCRIILGKTIHSKRADVVSDVVGTVLQVKNLSVTVLGRRLNRKVQTKSNISTINRLFSNPHLELEFELKMVVVRNGANPTVFRLF